jgi:hypothetical protein
LLAADLAGTRTGTRTRTETLFQGSDGVDGWWVSDSMDNNGQ